ncbi:hypothetical protein ATANTOWER_028675 [Ataeniobius toweri]|uniref:Uncharacterized protein n=1 Tax=Ataeniobius toweri TaxID=208326 RepID=A0ABU7BJ11_9TELE|nr:hypothetical protein [Ataeniobius toweri]
MHQPGKRARQANHSRPRTTRQPSQCKHKTCSTAPPTLPPTAARCPARRQCHRRKHWRKARKDWAPGQSHTQTPEVPQDACYPPSRTVLPAAPSRPDGQPLLQSEATGVGQ